MGFLQELKARGLMAQVTHEEELESYLKTPGRVAYLGIDPTGPSMHVGHLASVMVIRLWQKWGHKIIILGGGSTALIGDPTGKNEMRKMLSSEDVELNLQGLKSQLSKLINFDATNSWMLNNADWLQELKYIPLLREIGAHFSVNRMLSAECFKQRWDSGLSFLEFNYMIFQAYDFYHLNLNYDCALQLGGDDQWSNLLAGMDLIRRKSQKPAYCLTWPLLTTKSGKKMGKTEKGAVWLDPLKTSPYEFFQYFRNIEDELVPMSLNIFAELPLEETARLNSLKGQDINEAKMVLAYQVTALVHGKEAAEDARERSLSLFKAGLSASDQGQAPELFLDRALFKEAALSLAELLTLAGILPSKSEVRRLVQQKGLHINGVVVQDAEHKFNLSDIDPEKGLFIKKGKKNFYLLKIK